VHRLSPALLRHIRIQIRLRRGELKVIEAVARSQGVPRSEWIRAVLQLAVAQITSPQNATAAPEQVRRAPTAASEIEAHRAAVGT
jgi:hypothetical protein